jgi:hypothetical protein
LYSTREVGGGLDCILQGDVGGGLDCILQGDVGGGLDCILQGDVGGRLKSEDLWSSGLLLHGDKQNESFADELQIIF